MLFWSNSRSGTIHMSSLKEMVTLPVLVTSEIVASGVAGRTLSVTYFVLFWFSNALCQSKEDLAGD